MDSFSLLVFVSHTLKNEVEIIKDAIKHVVNKAC